MLYTVTGGNVKVGGRWLRPGDTFESTSKRISSPLVDSGFIERGEVAVVPEPKAPFIVPDEVPKPSDTTAIMCPDCDKVFPDEDRLAKHRARYHKAAVAKELAKSDEVDGQAPPE